MIKLVYAILLMAVSVTANAQIEKIITDRPGQTASPFIVPKNWIQFEAGFSKKTDRYYLPYKEQYFQHPWLLTKYGVGKAFELRLITELATLKEEAINGTVIHTGINSFQLGGKLHILKEKGVRPATAFIAHYDFHGLRTLYKGKDSIDGANFRFSMQHTLSEVVKVAYNVGMEWKWFGTSPYYIYTFSPGFNISERWYAFAEIYGYLRKHRSAETNIDGGIAFYVNDHFKIDARAGFGLNKKGPRIFEIGTSFRFKASSQAH